jgi:hypothetical protein
MSHMSAISLSVVIGAVIVMFASGLIQQRAVDRWTRETGRAPMINRGRGSWHRYLRSVEREIPASVRKQTAFWNWIGILSLILAMTVMAIDAGWHRH